MVFILRDLRFVGFYRTATESTSLWTPHNVFHCVQAFCPEPTQDVPLRILLVQGTHLEPADRAKTVTFGNKAFCKIILTV